MRRFKFKLEKILNIRRMKEDSIKAELMAVRAVLNREIRKREDFIAEEARSVLEMKNEREILSSIELQNYERFREGLENLIRKQDVIIADIREMESKIIERFTEARKETRILEKLKEKQFKVWNKDMLNEEAKFMTEIGVNAAVRRIRMDDLTESD